MNDYGVKETACTNCFHRKVCSLKTTFLKAQEAANRLSITTNEGDGTFSSIPVSEVSWIKPIILDCVHRLDRDAPINFLTKTLSKGDESYEQ
jgi:hypothetical protein